MKYKLGEICEIVSGSTPKTTVEKYWDGDIKWITPAEITEDSYIINDSVRKITELGVKKTGLTPFPEGTVILSSRAPIGKVAIAGCEMYCNQGFKNLICSDKINNKYLYWFLRGNTDFLNSLGRGATFKEISKGIVSEILISVPDIDDQIAAVNNLEKLSSIMKLRKQELEELDCLIKARFVELFEDGESPLKTIEELCSEIVDCPHTTPKYEGDLKNPAIRTSEIKKGYITWDSMKYVSDEEYEERVSRLRPKAGDIVYGREGTFGNAAVLPEGYKFCLGQRVMLLRPDYTKCTSEYLLHAVISDDVYRQAVGKNNASTVAHVNVKDVKQFKVPLPSFDKQNQFADFVKQVDKSKVAVQKALEETQTLFNSLMQEYFG